MALRLLGDRKKDTSAKTRAAREFMGGPVLHIARYTGLGTRLALKQNFNKAVSRYQIRSPTRPLRCDFAPFSLDWRETHVVTVLSQGRQVPIQGCPTGEAMEQLRP
jgi:hypothetical protein